MQNEREGLMTDDDRQRYSEPLHDLGASTSSTADHPLNGRSSESAPSRTAPEVSWLSAASNDALQPQTFDLSCLWRELCAGTWRFRDTFSTAERHFAVIQRVSVGKRSRVHGRNQEILTRVLLGQVPKVVASDMTVAISTVATGMQERLRSMGLPCRASNPPVLLVMAARAAARRGSAPTLGRLTRIKADQDKYWLVSMERPDIQFPVPLSQAEAAVVRQLVSGRTHAEICEYRATSSRTVANQLASAFKKFGVSGRGAIVQRLITHSLECQSAVESAGVTARTSDGATLPLGNGFSHGGVASLEAVGSVTVAVADAAGAGSRGLGSARGLSRGEELCFNAVDATLGTFARVSLATISSLPAAAGEIVTARGAGNADANAETTSRGIEFLGGARSVQYEATPASPNASTVGSGRSFVDAESGLFSRAFSAASTSPAVR
jgi:DNA-binding CsgD family transcriptional regulator